MATIIELDEALPPDKQVRLAGKLYTLPGDIPTPLFLRIQRATQTIGTAEDGVETLNDAILDLFRTRDEKITELPIGLTQLVTLFSTVYGAGGDADVEERPTRPTRGTGTSSRSAATRSRS